MVSRVYYPASQDNNNDRLASPAKALIRRNQRACWVPQPIALLAKAGLVRSVQVSCVYFSTFLGPEFQIDRTVQYVKGMCSHTH